MGSLVITKCPRPSDDVLSLPAGSPVVVPADSSQSSLGQVVSAPDPSLQAELDSFSEILRSFPSTSHSWDLKDIESYLEEPPRKKGVSMFFFYSYNSIFIYFLSLALMGITATPTVSEEVDPGEGTSSGSSVVRPVAIGRWLLIWLATSSIFLIGYFSFYAPSVPSDDWLLQWVVASPSASKDVKDLPQEVCLSSGQLEPIFEPISPSADRHVLGDLLEDPSNVRSPLVDGLDPGLASPVEGECFFLLKKIFLFFISLISILLLVSFIGHEDAATDCPSSSPTEEI
jgi:hypothetical protein